MNGNGTLTAALSVGVSPKLKYQLQTLARRQHRTLSGLVRVLLEEAMELEETLRPADPIRNEFEVTLTTQQAARLIRKGYDIQAWKQIPEQLPLI